MRWAIQLSALLLAVTALRAADPLPPPPDRYVSDQAGILSPATIPTLDAKLEAFERETSSQVLVATFPRVPDGYAMEDFTQRTAESWGAGLKADDNGTVFFVFSEDRRLRIEVGYGLEGAIPDATAKSILDREVTPRFRSGNFDGGVTAGINAILAAAKGEYEGTGRTNADRSDAGGSGGLTSFVFFIFALFIVVHLVLASRGGGTSVRFPGSAPPRRGWTLLPDRRRGARWRWQLWRWI